MKENKNNAVEKMENIMNENERKREEYARKKLHKKEEKARFKDMQKREKQRKQKERDEKIELLKKQRKQRSLDRQKGYLAAVITLGVSTLVLASILTYNFVMPSAEDKALEASYQRAFYDTVKEVDTIDVNLSKALNTADTGAMQNYLMDVSINAELAESSVSTLPLSDENKFNTTKLINQVGDYSKYINKKLNRGESLSTQDKETLRALYEMNLELKKMLDQTAMQMKGDFSFTSMLDEKKANILTQGLTRLENLSVEYPELIYDGPFSDGKDDRQIKGLTGEDIDEAKAKEIFIKTFNDINATNVQSVGKTNGQIECFNVQGEVNGELLYAQITVKGGRIAMFSYAGSCKETLIEQVEAISNAQEFLTKAGYENMKAVWINLADSVYTINFAVENEGVIVYPDLVKVRVCAETGMVIGIEATSYLKNHTLRKISNPTLTESACKKYLSEDLSVLSCRLALVPEGEQTETLCYEFECEDNGDTYYVYISAVTGRQVQMFKVISSTEGDMLM